MLDKNGKIIKAGMKLTNPWDAEPFYIVLEDAQGELYLGDFESKLENYSPWNYWEILE